MPSHKMHSLFPVLVLVCRFCSLDGNWFAATLLSSHHMLDQCTRTSGDERFVRLICLYKNAIFLPCQRISGFGMPLLVCC